MCVWLKLQKRNQKLLYFSCVTWLRCALIQIQNNDLISSTYTTSRLACMNYQCHNRINNTISSTSLNCALIVAKYYSSVHCEIKSINCTFGWIFFISLFSFWHYEVTGLTCNEVTSMYIYLLTVNVYLLTFQYIAPPPHSRKKRLFLAFKCM